MRIVLATALALAACKKDPPATTPTLEPGPVVTHRADAAPPVDEPPPPCEAALGHLADFAADAPTTKQIDESVAQCEAEAWSESVLSCLTASTDMTQVEVCLRPVLAPHAAYSYLEMIQASASVYAAGGTGFPAATAAPVPAASCCASANGLCETKRTDWKGAWAKLGFYAEGPSPFQLSYESSKKGEMVARAIGDLDCDGTEVVWELRGKMSGDQPEFEVVGPAPGAD